MAERCLAVLSNATAYTSCGRIFPVLTSIFQARSMFRRSVSRLPSTVAPDTDLRTVSRDGRSGSLQYLHLQCLSQWQAYLHSPVWSHTHPRFSRSRSRLDQASFVVFLA